MDHVPQLLEFYRKDPCQTLPNAFWKTARASDSLRVSVRQRSDGDLSALALWQESQLLSFWCADPETHPLSPQQVAETSFALVHGNCLSIFNHRKFNRQVPYFRLIHKAVPEVNHCPPGFIYQNVNPETEVEMVANFICGCYQNMKINSETVQKWLDHPVYDPELWVWILDKDTGEPAGLGIAEMDVRVPEASLEWIQVLPAYQKRGLGKAVVEELLHRAFGKVAFVTVAGEKNNVNQPEQLYRRCGFTGSDIWWLLAN